MGIPKDGSTEIVDGVKTPYYVRKLVGVGHTKTLAVGKVLPLDWEVVKVVVIDYSDGWVALRIDKVL